MKSRMRVAAAAAAVALMTVAGCSGDPDVPPGQSADGQSEATDQAGAGPFFPQCGGIGDDEIIEVTGVAGLIKTAATSVGCQWLVQGSIAGPHFSFTWFRGSPIGRERKTVELSRTSVEDVEIEGASGFIARGDSLGLGTTICEIGIQYGADFIEWSISYANAPFPDPCEVAQELTARSIRASR